MADRPASAPTRPALPRAVILGWLAVQLALPASYYLRDDPFDERFAWRMFSDVRAVSCDLRLRIDGEALHPKERFHVAWVGLARRARPSVLRGMVRHLCDEGATEVTLDARCPLPGGTQATRTVRSEAVCPGAVR